MVVNMLRAYKNNTAKVRLLQLEIDGIKSMLEKNMEIKIETDEEAIEGMSLQASTVDDFKPDCLSISNTTARVAVNYRDEATVKLDREILLSNIRDLESKMSPYIKDIKIVDVLIDSLNKEEQFIIKKFYIEGLQIYAIQQNWHTEIHESTIKNKKAVALAKIEQNYNEIKT